MYTKNVGLFRARSPFQTTCTLQRVQDARDNSLPATTFHQKPSAPASQSLVSTSCSGIRTVCQLRAKDESVDLS